jgi:hypothetical protein
MSLASHRPALEHFLEASLYLNSVLRDWQKLPKQLSLYLLHGVTCQLLTGAIELKNTSLAVQNDD